MGWGVSEEGALSSLIVFMASNTIMSPCDSLIVRRLAERLRPLCARVCVCVCEALGAAAPGGLRELTRPQNESSREALNAFRGFSFLISFAFPTGLREQLLAVSRSRETFFHGRQSVVQA